MKRFIYGVAVLSLAAAVAASMLTAEDESDDIDIIMSDMPLTGLKAINEGEHSSNDTFGSITLIAVEVCNGTPI